MVILWMPPLLKLVLIHSCTWFAGIIARIQSSLWSLDWALGQIHLNSEFQVARYDHAGVGEEREDEVRVGLHVLNFINSWPDLTWQWYQHAYFMNCLQNLLQCFCRKLDCEVGLLVLTIVLRDCSERSSWSGVWSFCPGCQSLLEKLPKYTSAAGVTGLAARR